MKKGIWVLISIVALVAIGIIITRAVRPPVPVVEMPRIRIGIIGPMLFIMGEQKWISAQMAAEDINAAGGVDVGGVMHQIEVIKADSNEMLSVPDAVSTMERIITVEEVDFVIGGFRTEAVLPMQEVAMDHRVIFLGTGAAHPELNMRVAADYERFKYWFRVTPLNSIYLGRALFGLVAMSADAIRRELGIARPRVAIMAEKAAWADPVVAGAERTLPALGMEIVGLWRPSPTAADVSAELTAIRAAGAHMIMTVFSGPVGVAFGRQWGELEIPAAVAGINVEAQKMGFWEATGGKGNHILVQNTFAPMRLTEHTIPFLDRFIARVGDYPTYTAITYDAVYMLKEAIERADTLDADALVVELAKTDRVGTASRQAFMGRDTPTPHDLVFGPDFATSVGTQWRDGELVGVWPDGRALLGDRAWEGLRYEGREDFKLPPWMVEYWRGRP